MQGTALVAGVADRVGLTGALSHALGGLVERRRRHDPGRVVRDLALALADGGDCLADLRALRDQETLFGALVIFPWVTATVRAPRIPLGERLSALTGR